MRRCWIETEMLTQEFEDRVTSAIERPGGDDACTCPYSAAVSDCIGLRIEY